MRMTCGTCSACGGGSAPRNAVATQQPAGRVRGLLPVCSVLFGVPLASIVVLVWVLEQLAMVNPLINLGIIVATLGGVASLIVPFGSRLVGWTTGPLILKQEIE